MTTKSNQGMYTRMRAKKNDPLSNLGTRTVHIVEKGVSITPATPDTETMRTASPATLIEDITPLWKKQHVADKGKDKANSCLSSVYKSQIQVLYLQWWSKKNVVFVVDLYSIDV